MTTLVHGETYTKIPPLPKITVANFADNSNTFQFNTANAAGEKTFWAGKLSISTTGVITGSATVERYDINGARIGKPVPVTIQTGSRISTPTSPIKPINSELVDNGEAKEQMADYLADMVVRFSNGFVARGKITYEHRLFFYPSWKQVYNNNTMGNISYTLVFDGYEASDDGGDIYHNISITGPKGSGHIGFSFD
jgi:hypothetical protein